MSDELRLCELELKLYQKTQVFNGGLEVMPRYLDNELTSIKVTNKHFIDSTDNANQQIVDDWLYTLIVANGKVSHVVGGFNYMVEIGKAFKGVNVLPNDTFAYHRS